MVVERGEERIGEEWKLLLVDLESEVRASLDFEWRVGESTWRRA